jgi:hypothetical protein
MTSTEKTEFLFNQASTDQGVLPENGHGRLILCDINGTLLNARDNLRVSSGLNKDLADFLISAEKRGYKVQLHSADYQSSTNFNLLKLYASNNPEFNAFLENKEIQAKASIEDSGRAFLSIDDSHGVEFISKAKHQWKPRDESMYATIEAWAKSSTPLSVTAAHIVSAAQKTGASQKHL